MAYNKSKHVETAQKLLHQGKVAQAIAEYQQILKHEPNEQVTLMTIGELYVRLGETPQAIDYFERLAQYFASDGFVTKAIAVYKRIAKLAPEEIRPLEKLAELYVQQGVMSEARPLYLQLAEIQLKNNNQTAAVELLNKLLVAEPDNVRIQVRLADLLQAMGKAPEAVQGYVAAAERVLARGDHAECEKLADKALKLEPRHLGAMTVKARSHIAAGKIREAAELLTQAPGLEKGGEQADLLLDLCLKNEKWNEAALLALKVLEQDEKNFGLAQRVCEALLQAGDTERAMALVDRIRIPMIDAGEHEAITGLLNGLAARSGGRLEPLEWLVDTYGRTSDSFRMPEALTQLGDAAMAAGDLARAKEVFEKLVDRQPESDAARRKLNEVMQRMGLIREEPIPMPETVEPLEIKVPMPPAPAPLAESEPTPAPAPPVPPQIVEPPLDEETQRFISQSLTDVDLFASYGLTQKAVSLLDAVVKRAPRHTVTLEKLLDFYLGAGDERRTAELAAVLEDIYSRRGDTRNADRFTELRRRFQRVAGLSDEQIAAAKATELAAPTVAAQPAEPPTPAAGAPAPGRASAVHELDLSDEWSLLLEHHKPSDAVPPAAPSEASEIAKPKTHPPPPSAPETTEFEIPVEEIAAEEEPAPTPKAPPQAGATPPVPAVPKEIHEGEPISPAVTSPRAKHEPEARPRPAAPVREAEEYELVLEPEQTEQAPAEAAEPVLGTREEQRSPTFAADKFLAELASEIEQLGLGPFEAPPGPFREPAAKAPVEPAGGSAEASPLHDVFEEFRAELGELRAEDEDLETHYNLGVAFREMGLLEEAISEFQKVAKASDQGRAFRYALQCCTLLGLSFMEKAQPAIAAMWYERALQTPGIDPETELALRYDLGLAQESAGATEAALKSFSQVYANNIDYRDVADRIATLEKAAR
jgi:tetratricopeptide (TPR) repeat protein